MSLRTGACILFLAAIAPTGLAQHEHPPAPPSAPSSAADPMAAMEEMEPMDHWMTMWHGYAFLTANRQGGPSGDREFESENHLSALAMRRAAGGKISLFATLTLEPATIPPAGVAELFQRGETYRGALLVDRQHPHELFVQIAAAWERPLSSIARIRLYVAPVGEPALGPVPYPHRLSASENPTAPLSHHNQDATHISYDVATVGVTASMFTLEGSAFHGAEPDENRWNLEAGALDSYSGRVTLRPARGLAIQVSSAHLERPEAVEPANQTRSTASIAYEKAFAGGFVAATAIAGRNQTRDGPEWGSLLEWTWKFSDVNFFYGRLESVDRDLYELVHKRQRPEGVPRDRTLAQAATVGFVRDLPLLTEAETGLGVDATIYRFSSRLDRIYGRHPASVHVFGRVRFGAHDASPAMGHAGH